MNLFNSRREVTPKGMENQMKSHGNSHEISFKSPPNPIFISAYSQTSLDMPNWKEQNFGVPISTSWREHELNVRSNFIPDSNEALQWILHAFHEIQ